MRDLEAIADRFEIEALRSEFTDAGMMHDYDRFASLFTHDGVWRIPHANSQISGHHSADGRGAAGSMSRCQTVRVRRRTPRETPPDLRRPSGATLPF